MKNISFHLNRKLWMALVMLLGLALPGFAQKITVRGYVDDETGEPLWCHRNGEGHIQWYCDRH